MPPVTREFRGLWVATVGNIDWPSQPGLPVERQKAELLAILDRAVDCRLNAVVLQVRPASDALYRSPIEPWSEYLTGQQGRPPAPLYDPLEFAIAAAHSRGLELHAWLNPFRVRNKDARSAPAASHISRTHPELVRQYGEFQWLDPGQPAAQEHVLRVVRDIVQRYDVDAIHVDDYFYPYPERDAQSGKLIEFPDEPTFQRYRKSGGKMSRDDWRRDNINRFVEKLYRTVKSTRGSVKIGVSPFGIWRPGYPPSVAGLDAFARIYADSRLWLMRGWVDYFAPQLYWPVDAPQQGFAALLDWWMQQNTQRRHIWPGLAAHRVGGNGWNAAEIVRQVRVARERRAGGCVLFSARPLMENRGGLADLLRDGVFTDVALPPSSPWLGDRPPAAPQAALSEVEDGRSVKLTMRSGDGNAPRFWLLRVRLASGWRTIVIGGSVRSFLVENRATDRVELIALSAVDAVGNASAPVIAR